MAERDEKGRFKKGHKPYKSPGRPKEDKELKDLLSHLVPKSVEILEQMLDSPDVTPRDKIKITEIIFDRVYGKAFQAVQVEAADTTVRIIDTDPEGAEYNA